MLSCPEIWFLFLSFFLLTLYTCVISSPGGRGHLDIQPQLVTALTWPLHKGLLEGRAGTTTDMLVVGRVDGSLGLIEILDHTTFHRVELEQCYRQGGQ